MAIGLDAFGVTFLARELKDLLCGRVVKRAAPGEAKVLNLHLSGGPVAGRGAPGGRHSSGRRSILRFLADPGLPLLCIEEGRHPGSEDRGGDPGVGDLRMPRFEDPLRGCEITDVNQIDLDRVIMITAENPAVASRSPDGAERFRLYFELIPPFPNLYLTDNRDIVLAVLFRAGTKTRRRILERGQGYTPPVAPGKVHPVDVTPPLLETVGRQADPDALSKTILGVGPFMSREIIARGRRRGTIFKAWTELLDRYRQHRAAATVFATDPPLSKGPPHLGLTWFKPVQEGAGRCRSVKSFNAAVAMVMDEFLRVSQLERQRASVLRHLSREIRRWKKASAQAEDAQARREQAADLRRWGEIIVANLARIERGAREAHLPDIYAEDRRRVVIKLDPRLTPQSNADKYFKMAKKAFRSAEAVEERLKTAGLRLAELVSLKQEAESPETPVERVEEIGRLISAGSLAKTQVREPVDERAERLGIRPRRYVVSGGWTVLVGRSARENDVLSHKYAAPSDLWFHARQAQGSHVVLRRGKKQAEVSKEAILETAAIAAHYSKARTSKNVPVSYTEKRYVKKVRRGPAGQAVMLREKVVFVNPALPTT